MNYSDQSHELKFYTKKSLRSDLSTEIFLVFLICKKQEKVILAFQLDPIK